MSPLDRIAQLTERAENAEKLADIALSNCEAAQREVALLRKANHDLQTLICELRAQVATARQELAREAGTIAKLAKDKREILEQLFVALCFVEDCEHSEDYKPGIVSSRLKAIRETISHHA